VTWISPWYYRGIGLGSDGGVSDGLCSSTVEEYMGQIEKLARELLELLTEGLGLERDRFNHYVEKERMMSMRFNLYPPCPQPELAIGLRAHTDPHLLTILHQDEVAGLQVFIDEQWVTVKPLPDCFVVNVGDLFQVPAPFPTSVSNEKKKNNPQKKHS
jgi:isopenicillin N synthase-like dioxygenase